MLKVTVQLGRSRNEHLLALKEGPDEFFTNVRVMFVTVTSSEDAELVADFLSRLVHFLMCARIVFRTIRSRTERRDCAARVCACRARLDCAFSVKRRVNRLLKRRCEFGFVRTISFSVLTKQEHVFVS